MRSVTITLIALVLLPVPGHAMSAGAATHPQRRPAAQPAAHVIAQRMAQALARQSRVEVRGQMVGPGTPAVHYLMRYQANGREYLQETGGAWKQVQIGKQRLTGLQAVSVGKRVYTTTDGTHWMRGSRLAPPTVLDVISLNPANAPCCVASKGTASQVRSEGQRQWHSHAVYALHYTTTSVGASIQGTMLIDVQSYLPVQYTEISRMPAITGTFALTYGGSFTIQEPTSH